jgi:hypothetical protein
LSEARDGKQRQSDQAHQRRFHQERAHWRLIYPIHCEADNKKLAGYTQGSPPDQETAAREALQESDSLE